MSLPRRPGIALQQDAADPAKWNVRLGTDANSAAPGTKLPGTAPIDTTGATDGQGLVYSSGAGKYQPGAAGVSLSGTNEWTGGQTFDALCDFAGGLHVDVIASHSSTDMTFGLSGTHRFIFQIAGGPTVLAKLTSAGVSFGTSSDPDASAALDVVSTTKGVLFPRMTTTQKNAISSPAEGLVVYDTTLHKLCVRTAGAWETITSS